MSVVEEKDKVHDENLTLVLAHSSQEVGFSHSMLLIKMKRRP